LPINNVDEKNKLSSAKTVFEPEVAQLVEKLKGKVAGIAFLIELGFLNGKKKIEEYPVYTIIKY